MVSVIIPVHNAAATLPKCLDSLIGQTYTDFEVILIENGSTDDSFAVCLDYAKRDPRFKAIDIGPCGGPSRPRNVGLERAQGDIIAFLDSDDWFGSEVLTMLHDCFSQAKADVVFFGICMVERENGPDKLCFPVVNSTNSRDICIQLHEQGCFGYTCCKAFRREPLNGIRFDEMLKLFEDELFALDAMQNVRSVHVVSEKYHRYECCYYHLNDSAESLMAAVHANIIELKNKEYAAWKHYLGDAYQAVLSDMANRAVRFCRYYIFEHHLPLKPSYEALIQTDFYRDALRQPAAQTKQISRGYFRFRWDWMIWKLKTTLK